MTGETRELEYDYSRLVVPFGPVHPALKEPVHFKVFVKKEEVVDVGLRLGHVHRGIEALAETRNLVQAMYLVERVCGICSHSHTTCFVGALEEIGRIQPSERALYLRTLVFELERLHSHLLWLGIMAYEIGFDTLFMFAFNTREAVLDLFEEITGNRVHHSMNVIGGVRWDLDGRMVEKVGRSMSKVREAAQRIREIFQDKTVEERLSGVGLLDRGAAQELCTVGPTARGSGLKTDVRKEDPYAAYGALEGSFSIVTRTEGDAYARTEVRIFEIFETINMINEILARLPGGSIRPGETIIRSMNRVPQGEAVSRVEAPRGELLYYVRTDGKGGLRRLKVRTPTLANIVGLRQMLIGGEVADIPVVVASIDPCLSCTNRITVIDLDKGGAGEPLRRRRRKWPH
ncbi:MAG: nickel-dependent hydrogenase large subunit [Candidatus Brockarchaeota archaeon]|nr:nickel-dependent hydrogenase large subunit [Candidatus Brockarchaeota archaeon]